METKHPVAVEISGDYSKYLPMLHSVNAEPFKPDNCPITYEAGTLYLYSISVEHYRASFVGECLFATFNDQVETKTTFTFFRNTAGFDPTFPKSNFEVLRAPSVAQLIQEQIEKTKH